VCYRACGPMMGKGKPRFRLLFTERSVSVGGSVFSLYELVRALDKSMYEPIVLFHGPNPFREQFETLGVPVLTLSKAKPQIASTVPRRDIAASMCWQGGRYLCRDVWSA
jgi:hypothetical protein